MQIILVGYGRMGKAIESITRETRDEVVQIFDQATKLEQPEQLVEADVAIDFSTPDSAFQNIANCLQGGIPVISGTTGWRERMDDIHELCRKVGGTFFYASNFSLGMQVMFRLNVKLARMMNRLPGYEPRISELHHIHKLDAPSGTAITLADGMLSALDKKETWVNEPSDSPTDLPIISLRQGEATGVHKVEYQGNFDNIEIGHEATDRKAFAAGVLAVGHWIRGKSGILGFDDMLNFD